MTTRTIVLAGSIDDDTVSSFMREFTELDAEEGPIEVRIYSPGGSVYAGFALYDFISNAENVVTTVGYGDVSSIALLVFQAGDKRVASRNCTFMLHEGSDKVEGSLAEIKADYKQMLRLDNLYCQILSDKSKSGLSFEAVQAMCEKITYLSAAEAMDIGLVDEVL